LHKQLCRRGVRWQFNPPLASHMGGIWERVIRSVKKILFALLSEQRLTDESLETLLTEVEYILHSRPLTPVVMDSWVSGAADSKPSAPGRPLGRKPPSGRFLCGGQLRSKAMETGAVHGRPVFAPLDQGVLANTAGSTEVGRCAEESCRGRYGTVVRRASPSLKVATWSCDASISGR